MNSLRRIILRSIFVVQRYYISLKQLGFSDFYKTSVETSKKLPDIIHLRELVIFSLVFSFTVFLMFRQSFEQIESYYLKDRPRDGGIYTEGTTGKFYRINPLYSVTNQADNDAVSLIFSGLTKREGGSFVGDLDEKWTLSEDKKIYNFDLKKNIKWHDGKEFSADDVIFTIDTIQNPDVRSPLFERWKGIKAEKTKTGVRFILKEPSASFIESSTVKIIPKHILFNVPPVNIQTVEFNINPIGTGIFKFKTLDRGTGIDTLVLEKNKNYFGKKAYLDQVEFYSYAREDDLLDDAKKRNILAVGNPPEGIYKKISDFSGMNGYKFQMPREVVEILNLNNEFLKEKSLRTAISYLIDRKKIIDQAVGGKGTAIYGPLDPHDFGFMSPQIRNSDLKRAEELLSQAGFVKKNGTLIFKDKEVNLKIVTSDDAEFKKTAEIISDYLKRAGIKNYVTSASMSVLQKEYIRPRNFDILIIGQNTGISPDLFALWHSSQSQDPGLSLTGYKDRKLDKFLEIIQTSSDENEKKEKIIEVQKIIQDESLVNYLYRPQYLFAAFSRVRGIKEGYIIYPEDRLANIGDWYLFYDRVMIDSK